MPLLGMAPLTSEKKEKVHLQSSHSSGTVFLGSMHRMYVPWTWDPSGSVWDPSLYCCRQDPWDPSRQQLSNIV